MRGGIEGHEKQCRDRDCIRETIGARHASDPDDEQRDRRRGLDRAHRGLADRHQRRRGDIHRLGNVNARRRTDRRKCLRDPLQHRAANHDKANRQQGGRERGAAESCAAFTPQPVERLRMRGLDSCERQIQNADLRAGEDDRAHYLTVDECVPSDRRVVCEERSLEADDRAGDRHDRQDRGPSRRPSPWEMFARRHHESGHRQR